MSTRNAAVHTGPSGGATTRMKTNDRLQIAASATSRARSAGLHYAAKRANGARRLEREQRLLAIEPAAVTGQRPVRSDHAMAGNEDRDRIAAVRRADGTHRGRPAHASRDLRIADRLAIGNSAERVPDARLEWRADRRERQVERNALAREVRIEHDGAAHRRARAPAAARRRPKPAAHRTRTPGSRGHSVVTRIAPSGVAIAACQIESFMIAPGFRSRDE